MVVITKVDTFFFAQYIYDEYMFKVKMSVFVYKSL